MSGVARLTAADIAHRVLVSGLAGLSVYGLYGMYRIHNDTMKAGELAWKQHLEQEAANGGAVAMTADSPLAHGQLRDGSAQRPS